MKQDDGSDAQASAGREPGAASDGAATPARQVVGATALVALFLLGWFAWAQVHGYAAATARAERDVRNVSRLLAEHAAGSFDAISETMRAVARLRADVARGIYRSQASMHANLRTLRGGSPLLDEVGWYDAYGERVASSEMPDPPRISAAREPFFETHVEGRPDVLHVARATGSSAGAENRIDVSWRLEALDGRFAGVAHGRLDARRFAQVYSGLGLGHGHVVSLVRADGQVLARWRDGTARMPGDGGFESPREGEGGVYHGVSRALGVEAVGSYMMVPRSEGRLYVDVAVARRVAMAAFWRELLADAGLVGVALVALGLGASALARSLARREALHADLAAASAAAEAARASAARIARSEADLQRALEAEREMVAEQRRFVRIASHEFRTPLTIIDGAAQRLSRLLPPASADGDKLLTRIRGAVTRMTEVIDRTLVLSDHDEGRMRARPGAIDVVKLVTELCARHRRIKPDLAIGFQTSREGIVAAGDPVLLERAVDHVLSNAVRYAGRRMQVDVAVGIVDTDVVITVRDYGVGIPPGELPRIFSRFYRAKNAGYAPGLGVGLHVVRAMMGLQNGSIDIDSVVDSGTTVTLRLPVAAVDKLVDDPEARRAAAS